MWQLFKKPRIISCPHCNIELEYEDDDILTEIVHKYKFILCSQCFKPIILPTEEEK